MAKKTKSKSVKKEVKNKNKNININIHIDQSKKTTGSNPKKSNIKTLPAFSSAPSSGGSYVRQFVQDPYYTQSQYEHMNLLKNYNNLVKQNNPMITGFKDNNKNDQKLIQNMNNSTINREYKIDDDSQIFDDHDTTEGKIIDFAINDDPRTDRNPENMLLRQDVFQQLPYNDLNTRDELLMYDKTTPLKIENNPDLPSPEPYEEVEQVITDYTKLDDPIANAMKSNQNYLNGYKIYTKSTMEPGKIFNTNTGRFVRLDDKNYLNASKIGKTAYTLDPYRINKSIQDVIGSGYTKNKRYNYWHNHEEPKKMSAEEKESDSEDDVFVDTRAGSKMENPLAQIMLPPPPPKKSDDNSSLSSRISNIFTPKKISIEVEDEIIPENIKQKPVAEKPKSNLRKKPEAEPLPNLKKKPAPKENPLTKR